MAVRIPWSLSGSVERDTGWSVLEHELHQQKAQTLGDLGSRVERALAALRAFDGSGGADEARRSDLVDEAAAQVWAFMVQREICGLRHWDAVVRDYRIPGEVLSRLGQTKSTRKP